MRQVPLILLTAIMLVLTGTSQAQESANFKISDATINGAGSPDQTGTFPSSASFNIMLASVAEPDPGSSMSSLSWSLAGGFVNQYAPPGEIDGLRFTSGTTIIWEADPAADHYNLYRDEISQLTSLEYGDCAQAAIAGTTAADGDPVPFGDGFVYLVTSVNRLDEEGSKGLDSSGTARPNPFPCP